MLNLFGNQMSRVSGTVNRALVVNKDLPMRRLKLHEYQAAKLLSKYRIPVPHGTVSKRTGSYIAPFTRMNSSHESFPLSRTNSIPIRKDSIQ